MGGWQEQLPLSGTGVQTPVLRVSLVTLDTEAILERRLAANSFSIPTGILYIYIGNFQRQNQYFFCIYTEEALQLC